MKKDLKFQNLEGVCWLGVGVGGGGNWLAGWLTVEKVPKFQNFFRNFGTSGLPTGHFEKRPKVPKSGRGGLTLRKISRF